ncbi:hypothetical protein RJT34_19327 [Clitoria ternatea]|uniref:Uncharacterized protein n=1 Tax=Clitoria ternatea TaxID=43366 RepID=A0AAN9IR07_CLITE
MYWNSTWLAAGSVWKKHQWNEQRKVRTFYDLLEKGFYVDKPHTKLLDLQLEYNLADPGKRMATQSVRPDQKQICENNKL